MEAVTDGLKLETAELSEGVELSATEGESDVAGRRPGGPGRGVSTEADKLETIGDTNTDEAEGVVKLADSSEDPLMRAWLGVLLPVGRTNESAVPLMGTGVAGAE